MKLLISKLFPFKHKPNNVHECVQKVIHMYTQYYTSKYSIYKANFAKFPTGAKGPNLYQWRI